MKVDKWQSFTILFIVLILSSCLNPNNNSPMNNLKIKVIKNNTIELYPIPDYAISELKSDTLSESQYTSLLSVFKNSGDKDLQIIEKPLVGRYHFTDSSLVFTPSQNLEINGCYLAISYIKQVKVDPTIVIFTKKLPGRETPTEISFCIR